MLLRLKFDLREMANKMLDDIPDEFWASTTTTFLDPAMAGGQFVGAIQKKLLSFGHSPDNVAKRIYGIEGEQHRLNYTVNKSNSLGEKLLGTFKVTDFLTKDFDVRFDVIVGNPPYQKNTNAKRWTLWHEFVNKAFELSNNVAFVVPQSITGPGEMFDSIKSHCKTLNIDVSKYFNVGSTFCYFVADKSQSIQSTKIITGSGELDYNISELPFLPSTIDDHTMRKLLELINRPRREWRRGEMHTSNTSRFSNTGKYAVMHTNVQELRSDYEHPNLDKIRVAVTLSGYPIFKVVTGGYVSQACFWTEFATVKEAQDFADECNSDKIQEYLQIFKWSGWNSRDVVEML